WTRSPKIPRRSGRAPLDRPRPPSQTSRSRSSSRALLQLDLLHLKALGQDGRQIDEEGRALTRTAGHLDGASVRFDDVLENVQSETQPAVVPDRGDASEPAEDPLHVLRPDPDALVG